MRVVCISDDSSVEQCRFWWYELILFLFPSAHLHTQFILWKTIFVPHQTEIAMISRRTEKFVISNQKKKNLLWLCATNKQQKIQTIKRKKCNKFQLFHKWFWSNRTFRRKQNDKHIKNVINTLCSFVVVLFFNFLCTSKIDLFFI